MQELVEIGRTGKAHGLKGECKAIIEDRFLEDFLKAEVIFIRDQGGDVPYFIEEVRGGSMIVKFEEVDTREAAERLAKRPVFLRKGDILEESERELDRGEPFFQDCIGYVIQDETFGELGTITEIEVLPQQEMAVIEFEDKTILIPLNDHFILRKEEGEKRLYMDLPEGLLDM